MKGLTAQQLNNIYSQHNKNELKLTFIPIWIPCSFKMENHLVQLLASTHSLAVVKSKIWIEYLMTMIHSLFEM